MSRVTEALVAAAQTSASELVPYVAVLGLGFLVGAWGRSLGSAVATVAGILLVIAAIVAFVVEFPVCPGGTRCF